MATRQGQEHQGPTHVGTKTIKRRTRSCVPPDGSPATEDKSWRGEGLPVKGWALQSATLCGGPAVRGAGPAGPQASARGSPLSS